MIRLPQQPDADADADGPHSMPDDSTMFPFPNMTTGSVKSSKKKARKAASNILNHPKRLVPPLPGDLAKYLNVAKLKRDSLAGQAFLNKVPKPMRPTPTPAIPSSKPKPAQGSAPDPIMAVGRKSLDKGGLQERPGWTATPTDMTQDLIHSKLALTQDTQYRDNSTTGKLISSSDLTNLPFHTLMVKWRQSYNFPVYTPRIVFAILSRFGKIDSLGLLSPNASFVVFHHEYHACRALKTPSVGFNYCPLICKWWYQERYKFPVTDAGDVKREDLLLSDGRLERNSKRHIAQIKREFWKKAASLSYDVSTFRP